MSSQPRFPYFSTPYGIAPFIVLSALASDNALAISVALFVKPIRRVVGIPLALLGTVLSVLQAAPSIQFASFAVRTAIATGI
jgi:hypothetical protein